MDAENQNILGCKFSDQVNSLLAYWDKDLVCRYVNNAFLKFSGKRREEVIGILSLENFLGPLFEESRYYIMAALNGETQTFQKSIPTLTGGARHILTHYYPDVNNGEVIGFFVDATDVTVLKLLEENLVIANEKLDKQNQQLLNFSNIVSHNLKSYANNLSAVLNHIDIAETEDEKTLMFGFLKKISVGFSSTVNNLNQIVKSQNQIKVESVQINLHDYVDKVIEILLTEIESTKTKILNEVNPEVVIFANPAYTESILFNLISNAIKYRHEDIPPVIMISSEAFLDRIVVKIKDNGKGIDLGKYGDDLFGIYKTFHGNPDAEGVGLYIIKYQIEIMGGLIDIESEVNHGTTFSITFKHKEIN